MFLSSRRAQLMGWRDQQGCSRRKLVGTGFLCLLVAFGCFSSSVCGAEDRLVAIADIHGAYAELVELLQVAELVDQQGNWIGGTATLVQTGDMLDRGLDVRKVMDLLRKLQDQAAEVGGEVVVLLGNHEAMNLLGFRRDINTKAYATFADEDSERRVRAESKQYGKWLKQRARARKEKAPRYQFEERRAFSERHPPGYFEYVEALGPGGEYGAWLRSLPMIAIRGDIAFLHGGISPKYFGRSVEELNQKMWQEVALLDACREQLLADEVIFLTSDPNEMVAEGMAEIASLSESIASVSAPLKQKMVAALDLLKGCVGYQDWFLVEDDSPIWYRGFARLEEQEVEEVVSRGLEGLGVNRFVVGHTPQKARSIVGRLEGRVYLLDTGMLTQVYRGRASALEFANGEVHAIYIDGRVLLEPAVSASGASVRSEGGKGGSGRKWSAEQPTGNSSKGEENAEIEGVEPSSVADDVGVAGFRRQPRKYGSLGPSAAGLLARVSPFTILAGGLALSGPMAGEDAFEFFDGEGNRLPFASDAELVAFLSRGDVEFVGKTDGGINRPRKAKVSADGITIDAVFRTVDSSTGRFRTKQDVVLPYLRDSFRYEPAAYRLSVVLGLRNVPPAVLRTVGGRRGSLQVWMHGVVDEEGRRARGQPVVDRVAWRRQLTERLLFDRLIGNTDRNQGNLLFHTATEKVWLIDHTRAFVALSEPPDLYKVTRCRRGLYQALKSAKEGQVQEWMEPYLLAGEIAMLWDRWESIVQRLDWIVKEYGENAVLY